MTINIKKIQPAGIAMLLGLICLLSTSPGSKAQTETQIMQACQNSRNLSLQQAAACLRGMRNIVRSYPALGQTVLMNAIGDKMNSIVAQEEGQTAGTGQSQALPTDQNQSQMETTDPALQEPAPDPSPDPDPH